MSPPKRRDRDWGQSLLQAFVTQARTQAGLEQITFTVVAANKRTRQFYASEGFMPFAQEKRTLKIGSVYYDEEKKTLFL